MRQRVGTQMDSYDKKAKGIKSKEKNANNNKFSKIKNNPFENEGNIFNTEINTNLSSSKVTKIREAK